MCTDSAAVRRSAPEISGEAIIDRTDISVCDSVSVNGAWQVQVSVTP
ncbi:hypothetical protein GXW82_15855 [Streptacidiphilus sp. 4-A2]|nr:hypothetical protein [Streptacidiphilus sp. 4-A2]